jgi:hypothetical protein
MDGVMSATPAELLRLQAFGMLFFVFGHGVIALLAVTALQGNDVSHKIPMR